MQASAEHSEAQRPQPRGLSVLGFALLNTNL